MILSHCLFPLFPLKPSGRYYRLKTQPSHWDPAPSHLWRLNYTFNFYFHLAWLIWVCWQNPVMLRVLAWNPCKCMKTWSRAGGCCWRCQWTASSMRGNRSVWWDVVRTTTMTRCTTLLSRILSDKKELKANRALTLTENNDETLLESEQKKRLRKR